MSNPTVVVTPAQYTVTTTPGAVTVKTAPTAVAVVSAAPQGPPGPPGTQGPPGAAGASDHDALSHLDYAAAGHTGFTPSARQVSAGTGLSGGGDLSADRTLSLANTAVTPGPYTNAGITVDAQGRITAASSGSGGGVTSFNTRAGAVTLTTADVTGALGFSDFARLGQDNVLAGGSLSVPSPAGGTGTGCERFGTGALPSNTDGSNNTAVGNGTLAANTTGGGNTAVGQAALRSNTTGGSNAALGDSALAHNTTGSGNMAIGHNALALNVAGANNMAIGVSALLNNTASGSVAIGAGALSANTTGGNNVAVGTSGLLQNSAGTQNVAVGAFALYSNTAADGNTAVGYQALQNATGGLNSALGINAAGATLTTGTGNTLLGASADVLAGSTANGVALGCQAVCASNELAVSPLVNFQTWYGFSSTGAARQRARLVLQNVDNTEAIRKYRFLMEVWDTAAREVMRGEADGAAPRVGFLGAAAIARRAVNAACTDLATAVALTNQLRQLLIDLGYAQ